MGNCLNDSKQKSKPASLSLPTRHGITRGNSNSSNSNNSNNMIDIRSSLQKNDSNSNHPMIDGKILLEQQHNHHEPNHPFTLSSFGSDSIMEKKSTNSYKDAVDIHNDDDNDDAAWENINTFAIQEVDTMTMTTESATTTTTTSAATSPSDHDNNINTITTKVTHSQCDENRKQQQHRNNSFEEEMIPNDDRHPLPVCLNTTNVTDATTATMLTNTPNSTSSLTSPHRRRLSSSQQRIRSLRRIRQRGNDNITNEQSFVTNGGGGGSDDFTSSSEDDTNYGNKNRGSSNISNMLNSTSTSTGSDHVLLFTSLSNFHVNDDSNYDENDRTSNDGRDEDDKDDNERRRQDEQQKQQQLQQQERQKQHDPINHEKQLLLKEIEILKLQVMDYEIRYQNDIDHEKKRIEEQHKNYVEQLEQQIQQYNTASTPSRSLQPQPQRLYVGNIANEDSMLPETSVPMASGIAQQELDVESKLHDPSNSDIITSNKLGDQLHSIILDRLSSFNLIDDTMKSLLQQHLLDKPTNEYDNNRVIQASDVTMTLSVEEKQYDDKDEYIRALTEQMNVMKNEYTLLEQQLQESQKEREPALKYPYDEINHNKDDGLVLDEKEEEDGSSSWKIRLELELEQMKNEKNYLLTQIEVMTNQIEQQVEQLRKQSQEQQEQQRQLQQKQRLEQERRELMNQIENMKIEHDESNNRTKMEYEYKIQNLENENEELKHQIEGLKVDMEKNKGSYELDDIIGQLDLVEAEHKEIMNAQTKAISEKDVVISALSIQLSDAKREQDDLEQLVIEYKEKYDIALSNSNQLQHDLNDMKLDYEALFQIHKEYVTNAEERIKQECDQAREEMIVSAEEQFERANDLYRKLKHEYDTSQQTIKTLENEYNAIHKQCISLHADIEAMEKKHQEEVDRLKSKHQKAVLEHKEQQQRNIIEIQTSNHVMNELRNQLSVLNDDYTAMQTKLSKVIAKKEQLQVEYDDLKAISEELMSIVEEKEKMSLEATAS